MAVEALSAESPDGKRSEPCFVYVIRGVADYVKIGRSRAPASRLRELSTAAPEHLELHHTWRCTDRRGAAALEAALHTALTPYRRNGEWFRVDPEWAVGIGNALERRQLRRLTELMTTLQNFKNAERISATLEAEGNAEEADVWQGICDGYLQRAWRFGLPKTALDIALRA